MNSASLFSKKTRVWARVFCIYFAPNNEAIPAKPPVARTIIKIIIANKMTKQKYDLAKFLLFMFRAPIA